MWLLTHSSPIWQKYFFSLLLVTTLVGCATPLSDDQFMEREGHYREMGSPAYDNEPCCDTIKEREYKEIRAREEAERNNQPHVNTSQECNAQNPCKEFKAR